MKLRESYLQLSRLIVDVILLNLAILFFGKMNYGVDYLNSKQFIVQLIHGNILLMFSYLIFSHKVINLREHFWYQAVDIVTHSILFIAISAAVTFLFLPEWFPREFIIQCTFIFLVLKLLFYGIIHLYIRYFGQGELDSLRTVILGMDDTAFVLRREIDEKPILGYDFVGFVCKQFRDEEDVIGSPEDLAQLIDEHQIQMIFATLSVFGGNHKGAEYLKICNSKGVRVWYVMEDQRWVREDVNTEKIGNLVLINPHKIPLDNISLRVQKRVFDVVFSFLVITLLLSWLLPILAILIKACSRGPVFFIQKRTGINNRTFYCIKLRSMQLNPESDTKQAVPGDSRTTCIGRFLRRTNMDELPQFFNVFLGNMSVVGPRPHMLKHTNQYSKLINHYLTRHFVKPGITGWAQINGYRGETSELWMMEKRVKYDTKYMRNWSLWWDVKIIWLTVFGKYTNKNAH